MEEQTRIKICGLTRLEDIDAVNELKPEYVGFVFAKSRRQITKEHAVTLRRYLDPEIQAVGVFVNELPAIVNTEHIQERHRHRYEFNNSFKEAYEAAGMKCVGINPESDLVEIVEIPALKWFVGTQFHPEYSSTVLHPHPLFVAFVKAAIENENEKK